MDDGSTDSSAEIIDEYANKDSRVMAIHQKNKGVFSARNTGLKAAQIIKTVEIDNFIYDSIKKVYPEISKIVFEWIIQDNRGWHAVVKKEDIELANKMKKAIMRNKWKILFSKMCWKEKIIMILGRF